VALAVVLVMGGRGEPGLAALSAATARVEERVLVVEMVRCGEPSYLMATLGAQVACEKPRARSRGVAVGLLVLSAEVPPGLLARPPRELLDEGHQRLVGELPLLRLGLRGAFGRGGPAEGASPWRVRAVLRAFRVAVTR
jgi:hypothetical protein